MKEARDFLNSRRKGLGSKFLKEYKVLLKTLQSNPDFQVRYKNIHCLPLKTFKYMVHFTIDIPSKTVHLYAVLSTHQNPNKHWL